MERYDYNEAMREDIREYIAENYEREEIAEKLLDRDEWEEQLRDDLWTEDSVTVNASGSYTFSTWEAEENLCHNMGLLEDALREFGSEGADILERGAEWCDVTIRCYLLADVLSEVLDEYEEELSDEIEAAQKKRDDDDEDDGEEIA